MIRCALERGAGRPLGCLLGCPLGRGLGRPLGCALGRGAGRPLGCALRRVSGRSRGPNLFSRRAFLVFFSLVGHSKSSLKKKRKVFKKFKKVGLHRVTLTIIDRPSILFFHGKQFAFRVPTTFLI